MKIQLKQNKGSDKEIKQEILDEVSENNQNLPPPNCTYILPAEISDLKSIKKRRSSVAPLGQTQKFNLFSPSPAPRPTPLFPNRCANNPITSKREKRLKNIKLTKAIKIEYLERERKVKNGNQPLLSQEEIMEKKIKQEGEDEFLIKNSGGDEKVPECDMCHVKLEHPKTATNHFNGKRHMANAQFCHICIIEVRVSPYSHKFSQEHQNNLSDVGISSYRKNGIMTENRQFRFGEKAKAF